MTETELVLNWLRGLCGRYEHAPVAVYRRQGSHSWPLKAENEDELDRVLLEGGHLLPLPKEPAALANVIEVSLIDFLIEATTSNPEVIIRRGTERGYPDLELTGPAFNNNYFAIDIKSARRKSGARGIVSKTKTQSRITLYTGNTYFKYPELHWPNTFRPFNEYVSHIDIIAIYTLDETSFSRIRDLEFIVQEAWRIGSRQRSSTTREYIGAVDDIGRIRNGDGEFDSEASFYKYWRKFNFKVGAAVAKQLEKLLSSDLQQRNR